MVEGTSTDGTPPGVRASRRTFVKALGVSGAITGISGCISGPDDNGNGGNASGTVQFAADTLVSDSQSAFNDALHEAGLSEDVTVEVLGGSQVSDDRQQQYTQWLQAGQEDPALLMMDSGWTIPFIARDQLANLSEEIPDVAQKVQNNYFEASVATAQNDNGDLHAVPFFPDFPTMQYRKDLVTDAGYDPDGNNWATESISWKRFAEVTKDVQQQNNLKHGFTFQADAYEGLSCCTFNEFMTSWGGAYFGNPQENLFGPVGDRPITVQEEPVLNAIRMVRTFIDENDSVALNDFTGSITPRTVIQWVEDTSLAPFTNGDAVMHRNWPYAISQNGADDAFGEDLGVMPIPYGVTESEAQYPGTGGPVAALGGQHVALNPNAANKDAALQVIEAMTAESFALSIFEEIGFIPPQPSVLDSQKARDLPVIGRYVDTLQVAGENAIPRPVTVAWPQESDQIGQEVNAAFAGDKSPEQAMSDLAASLEEIEQSASS